MTPAEIKGTPLYKATLPQVLAVWPDKADEYAKELAIASETDAVNCWCLGLMSGVNWSLAKQGYMAWMQLYILTNDAETIHLENKS